MKEPRLCDFKKVELYLPRDKLLACALKESYLDKKEFEFCKLCLDKIEAEENKLKHWRSVVEKGLLRAYYKNG